MRLFQTLQKWLPLALIAGGLALAPSRATAGFASIADDNASGVASYLAATTEMPIAGVNGDPISSLSGPHLTISFGSPLEKIASPGWGVWGSAMIPDVLSTTVFATSATFDFSASSTVTTFGFEAEPGLWEVHGINAEFFNGAVSLGTITFDVDGDGGSRLFAATLDNFGTDLNNTDKFTRVVISSDTHFAVGNIRYAATSSNVPEPTSLVMLLGVAAVGIPAIARRRRMKAGH